jgi:ferrous iron transport protein A
MMRFHMLSPLQANTHLGLCPLSELPDGQAAHVTHVSAPTGSAEWSQWLAEIGFLPGERVQIMARAMMGDPLVVRVGDSTFALRRAEAACVFTQTEAAKTKGAA